MIKPLDFAQGFDSGYSKDFVNRRCINVFRNVADGPSLSNAQVVGVPGISEFSDCEENTCRGIFSTLGRLFSVNGTSLFEYESTGAYTNLGFIADDDGGNQPVKFATNGFIMVIITGDRGYFFTLSTDTLVEISDAVFTGYAPILDVTYKDGYFFYLNDTVIFQGSLVTDSDLGTGFNSLNFAEAETNPDGNIAIHNSNGQVYVLGENTVEQFYNTGSTGFVLARVQGGTIQKGCVANNTVIDFQGSMVFLGRDLNEGVSLYIVRGAEYQKISIPSIDYYCQTLSNTVLSQATCYSVPSQGSSFLHFDVGDACFVYDFDNSKKTGAPVWHERQSGSIDWYGFTTFRGIYSATCFNKCFVGDKDTGVIGEVSFDVYTEYDAAIPHGLTTQPFDSDSVRLNEVKAYCNVGGAQYNTTYEPVYWQSVTTSTVYAATTYLTDQTLSDDGRTVNIACTSTTPDYVQYSDKCVPIETGVETGFAVTLENTTSAANSAIWELRLSPVNMGGDVINDESYFVAIYLAAGATSCNVITYIFGYSDDNSPSGSFDYTHGDEIFVSVLADGVTTTVNVYLGSSTTPVFTGSCDTDIPRDMYLSGGVYSATSANSYIFTLPKYPINPANCALLSIATTDEVKTVEYYPFTESSIAPVYITNSGYTVTYDSTQVISDANSYTDEFTIEPNKQYTMAIDFDASDVPAAKIQEFSILIAESTIDPEDTFAVTNAIEIYFTYTKSTDDLDIFGNAVIDSVYSAGVSSTYLNYGAAGEPTIYISFYNDTNAEDLLYSVSVGDIRYPLAFENAATGAAPGNLPSDVRMMLRWTRTQPTYVGAVPISISTVDTPFIDSELLATVTVEDVPEPTIEMSYSVNGGRSFNTPVVRVLGSEGEYTQQVKWSRLGIVDQARVLRFFSDSKVKFAINKIEVDIDGSQ